MNLLFFLTFIVGFVSSVDAQGRPGGKRGAPVDAPSGYKTATGHTTVGLSKEGLKELPSNFIHAASKDAAISVLSKRRALRQLRGLRERQSNSDEFYECRDSTPAPATTDCDTVVSSVLGLGLETLIVAPNACLTFQFGTCWGFFCALCAQLTTGTDFVGAALADAHALCVAHGQAGTVVAADDPHWEAGFVYQGDDLPSYDDVC
ncbi:hypothetical protein F4779DRAFT_620621 [Xylariaceae sp. FL0662B]|nr:hypothetical protein F4779DRAFT_620621 [Xylariaceae sp. FL0662B]